MTDITGIIALVSFATSVTLVSFITLVIFGITVCIVPNFTLKKGIFYSCANLVPLITLKLFVIFIYFFTFNTMVTLKAYVTLIA